MEFTHPAAALTRPRPLVYTAMSKHLFYYRMFISKYVLEQGHVPLNPFMIFDYFLLDAVDRDTVREANNSVVMRVDEVWVFGPVSNGVLSEIILAKANGKPVRYFEIRKPHLIVAIEDMAAVAMEEDVLSFRNQL